MKRLALTTLILTIIPFLTVNLAPAYTVNLIYFTSVGLMDENMAFLNDGDLIQLIYSTDNVRDPPNIYNGMPTGDDVLWEWTTAGTNAPAGSGRFLDFYQYDSSFQSPGYVYIRFFNSDNLGHVTYYGMSDLHILRDVIRFDIWDVTAGGLYLWTEYPFIIIPEPETWLTLLPAIFLGIFIYRKTKKRNKSRKV